MQTKSNLSDTTVSYNYIRFLNKYPNIHGRQYFFSEKLPHNLCTHIIYILMSI